VRQYSGRLLAVARRLLGNEHDAQDALQEAFLSAFKALAQFTGTAKLSTWLHRIVVNAALMKLRSRRRKPEAPIDDLLPHFDAQGEWASRVTNWEASSEMLLQRQETRALVRRCVDRLPETYRTVLLLRDIEELDTEEAASILGITPNAVKIRLHRARQVLRTLLERELVHA
jgi:RNA polymerase sigma-70 factor, ECF subfamily